MQFLLEFSCIGATCEPSLGGRMRRSVGLGLLMTLACPLVLAGQGVPAADSLAKAASAASAANTVAINFVWTLVAGFLVMFMQAGFAMVETGFTRAKNAAHTVTMNFMVYGIAMLAYWVVGFALPPGGFGGLATLGGSDQLHRLITIHVAIPGHNIPMAMYGTFILCFGWFGFNAGSTLAGSDVHIAVIATNTMLAGAAGGISAMIYVWLKYGKPDPSMLANGTLAGLVAITAPCAFVNAPAAVLIGLVAGVIVCVAVLIVERKLKPDDPVGAISVHGFNGAWGVLAVGLFADGTYGAGTNNVAGPVTGLFYGGYTQIVAQLIGVCTNFLWVGASTALAWKITGLLTKGHRVTAEVEDMGLDSPEMGVPAYPGAEGTSDQPVLKPVLS